MTPTPHSSHPEADTLATTATGVTVSARPIKTPPDLYATEEFRAILLAHFRRARNAALADASRE